MRRVASRPRPGRDAEFAAIGFRDRYPDGGRYWDESVRYEFTLEQVERDVEAATAELHALALEVVDRAARDEATLARLKIPAHAWDVVAESWRRRDPSLYGRFDLVYDGAGAPKLLEYNADTPTSLFEAAVVQWRWLEQNIARGELPAHADQFNSAHEKLIARWAALGDGAFVHFACMTNEPDDAGTLAYLEDCARQAGLPTAALDMGDIGLGADGFYDRSARRIERMFKLYPWEWMFADEFGRAPVLRATRFVEPPWKLILSCKGALALMWERAPGHPNLLPCGIEGETNCPEMNAFARKPLYSREGADVELHGAFNFDAGRKLGYGAEGYVRQALAPLPDFDGARPVIGAWVVGDEPAGMGIREDDSSITSDRARFIPHAILG